MRIVILGNFLYLQRGGASVLNSILETLNVVFPDAEFTVSSRPKADFKRFNVKMFDSFFPHSSNLIVGLWKKFVYACLLVITIMSFMLFRKSLKLPSKAEWELIEAFVKADIILLPLMDGVNSVYSFSTPLSNLYPIPIAKMLRKPVMLYAVSIGPFTTDVKGRVCGFLTKHLLNRVDLITIRGPASKRWLEKLGISEPSIYVTADPAFLLQVSSSERIRKLIEELSQSRSAVIGVNTSALIYRYGFSDFKKSQLKLREYVKLLARIVDYLIYKFNALVVLLPHSFVPGDDDRVIARQVEKLTKNSSRVRLILEKLTPEELKAIIGCFDLFIATRHHPFVHGISMHVPTIGIDYIEKMKGDTAKVLEYDEWVLDIKDLNTDALISKIDLVWSNREQIKRILSAKERYMRKLSWLNADLLKELVERRQNMQKKGNR